MLDRLFQHLTRYPDLSARDRKRIEACAWRVDRVPARTDLVREGSGPHLVNVMLDGWACRYKQLDDGRRQITAVLFVEQPALVRAFWLDTLVSLEIQSEWTVSLGRRNASERMAHLFCELMLRLRAVGRAGPESCEMPLTQADIGDALGLSAVHVNRTLKELRGLKLIELKAKRLVIRDEPALQALARFDPAYLHLQRIEAEGHQIQQSSGQANHADQA